MNGGIFREARAQGETLIRTAIAAEFNSARLAEFSAAGVAVIEWVAVIDDATTDECLQLDGKQWYLPRDPDDYDAYIPIGHDLPFPGPVAHWNCRSTVIPVDAEEVAALELPLAMEMEPS